MKNYYRIMLGKKSAFYNEALGGGYIGTNWLVDFDLTQELQRYDNFRDFNKVNIPKVMESDNIASKIGGGLACGMLWTVAKYLKIGDIIITPDSLGNYAVAEISSDYYYVQGESLPHRRRVNWYPNKISWSSFSESLKNSSGSVGTVCDLTKYSTEIESLIGGQTQPVTSNQLLGEETDPLFFALEKHLEDFLVKNWANTDLGKEYDIFSEGDLTGQQYPSDTGPIDILAVSKDKSTILVIELKRGRASDVVVGQIQRYMGFVKEELASPNQTVKGVIIAFEDDIRVRRALSVTQNIEFFTYKLDFKLNKVV